MKKIFGRFYKYKLKNNDSSNRKYIPNTLNTNMNKISHWNYINNKIYDMNNKYNNKKIDNWNIDSSNRIKKLIKSPINNVSNSISNNSLYEDFKDININDNKINNLQNKNLFDFSSKNNNFNNINKRIEDLENCLFTIKQVMNSITSIAKNISDNYRNYPNNIKKEIKNITYNRLNEKTNPWNKNKNNENICHDNKSLYTECLEEEVNKFDPLENNKKFDIQVNKKIDEKLKNLEDEIKEFINNKFLQTSINKIENVKESKNKEIDKINENIDNKQKNILIRKNEKITGVLKDFDVDEKKNVFDLTGEQLYYKLKQKEEKLKFLQEESKKYLNDNGYTYSFSDYLNEI